MLGTGVSIAYTVVMRLELALCQELKSINRGPSVEFSVGKEG